MHLLPLRRRLSLQALEGSHQSSGLGGPLRVQASTTLTFTDSLQAADTLSEAVLEYPIAFLGQDALVVFEEAGDSIAADPILTGIRIKEIQESVSFSSKQRNSMGILILDG